MIQYGKSVLSGLTGNPNVKAFGKARGMEASAGLGMEQAQQDQKYGLAQMQADSQSRQQEAANRTMRATNETQEQAQAGDLRNRMGVFNTGMAFNYANLQRQRQLAIQQTLLNGLARNF